jgi:mannose-6-phosphate isomerase-like protein (cupin superfamily)
MRHIRGEELFAVDDAGFRRKVIDEGGGPVRSYAYSPGVVDDSVEHCHAESIELFLAVDGEGSVVVEGVEVPMSRSDVLIVEPGEYHFVRRNGANPLHLLAVVAPNLGDVRLRSETP